MGSALEGLRVLDLTSGPAGGLATMVLADFGAEVVLVERPGGDPLAALPAAPLWRRGKHVLPLDLDADGSMNRLHDLAAGADVLIASGRPSSLARRGLDFPSLHPRHPHLVVCHVSGFGDRGPLAEIPGYEHVVAARAGRMRLFSGIAERPGPVFSALQVGVHACAQSAAAGILAALHARERDGRGRHVREPAAGASGLRAGRHAAGSALRAFPGPDPGAAAADLRAAHAEPLLPSRPRPATGAGCSSATSCRTCSTTSCGSPICSMP
jgi:crotonobetainyl-CoA:carnitine CoA-transferase CaiB-like acyl-CoA transferase